MINRDEIRDRFLRDPVPVRLGGLAANLNRIRSFIDQDAGRATVESVIDESKYFIEWTAADTEIDTAAELVELQIELACWHLGWDAIWADVALRTGAALRASEWSERVLQRSGLLDR
jgi:hypothetical protein